MASSLDYFPNFAKFRNNMAVMLEALDISFQTKTNCKRIYFPPFFVFSNADSDVTCMR